MSAFPRPRSKFRTTFPAAAFAVAMAFLLFSGPEASAFAVRVSPGTGVAAGAVAGAGWSLKKNIERMTDRLSTMLGDAIGGRGDKLREHEAWFEKTPGRLIRDAFPVLSVPKRALDAGKEKLAVAARKVERFSKRVGDRRAALAVGKKDRDFLETETGILGRKPLPEPKAAPKAAPAAASVTDTDPWGVGKESSLPPRTAQKPAPSCWMETGGRACPRKAASPWDEEEKSAGEDAWGTGADRGDDEQVPPGAQSDYESALNRALGESVGGIVEDIDYDSMLAALEEKEAAEKRSHSLAAAAKPEAITSVTRAEPEGVEVVTEPKCMDSNKYNGCWSNLKNKPNCSIWLSTAIYDDRLNYIKASYASYTLGLHEALIDYSLLNNLNWDGPCSSGVADGHGTLYGNITITERGLDSFSYKINALGQAKMGKLHGEWIINLEGTVSSKIGRLILKSAVDSKSMFSFREGIANGDVTGTFSSSYKSNVNVRKLSGSLNASYLNDKLDGVLRIKFSENKLVNSASKGWVETLNYKSCTENKYKNGERADKYNVC